MLRKSNLFLNRQKSVKHFNWRFFFRSFFNSLIKCGKRKRLYTYFMDFFYLLKKNGVKSIKNYLLCIFYKIKPVLSLKLYQKGHKKEPAYLVWHYFSNKLKKKYEVKAVSWLKKSVLNRKEKTLVFKLYGEFENIRYNKGATILQKKMFYESFKKFKSYKHMFKYLKDRF